MKRFDGKIVLCLGTIIPYEEVTRYLKSEGAYVILAVKYPTKLAYLRRTADEAVCIDVFDVSRVVDFAREKNVDAVICATTRGKEIAIQANKELGIRYSCTLEQWQNFMDKIRFRRLCDRYGVPTPETYYMGALKDIPNTLKDELDYPVIVKPTDRDACDGISICYRKKELPKALEKAGECSDRKEIIVEKYICGVDVTFTYVIQNGQCVAVNTMDKLVQKHSCAPMPLEFIGISPSGFCDAYFPAEDEVIKRMLLGEGLDNCSVFLQTVYSNGSFYVFEAGLRMEGTQSYQLLDYFFGLDYQKFIVDSILKANTDYDVTKNDYTLNGRMAIRCPLYAKDGYVTKVTGMEKLIEKIKCFNYVYVYSPSYRITKPDVWHRWAVDMWIEIDSLQDILPVMKTVRDTVKIYDNCGKEVSIRPADWKALMDTYQRQLLSNKSFSDS